MRTHWHGFAYTGSGRPSDGAARDPARATPPNEIALFFRKPRSMLAGTFQDAAAAYGWLAAELDEHPPPRTALPVAAHLGVARDRLGRGGDAYVAYYTDNGFIVRALLVCPREGQLCPGAPELTP